jgi:hypothetical protein
MSARDWLIVVLALLVGAALAALTFALALFMAVGALTVETCAWVCRGLVGRLD